MPLRSDRWSKAICNSLFVVLVLAGGMAQAQTSTPAPAAPPIEPLPQPQPQPASFKPEEIEALVAPVALYPDSVLAQVLMASTYPLEIVHAARWVKANPNVKGDAAVKAVENQPWDVSVKSLVAFPQILEPMNDRLDWTQKLGDAFLAQEKDVLAAVQRLRARAGESGNLKSNAQQNVIVEPAPAPASGGAPASTQTIVRIEPADPQVIYVPAYNPTVVYGAWSYPTYPPYSWPPPPAYYPGAALATGFAWGVGLAAAGAIFSDCNWGGGDVNVNVNKAANIDRNFDRTKAQGNGNRWQHDASHRQGVAYRDNATRQKYAGNVAGADARSQYRGRNTGAGTSERLGAADRAGAGNRAATADRAGAGNRAATADRAGAGNRAATADRAGAGNRAATADRTGAGNRAATADRTGAGNRAATADRAGAGNRAATADRAGAGNRAATADRAAMGNRTSNRGGGYGGGYSGGGRDSAFQGVGAGQTSQRNADRGRSSMQNSGASRAGGGGMRGGGGGGGRGRR